MDVRPRSLLELVEHQVGRWKIEQREAVTRGVRQGPIITVSRLYGTPGSEIAWAVARQLDYSFWDKELLHAIAEQTRIKAVVLEALDERRRSNFESLVYGAFQSDTCTEDDYRRYLEQTVKAIARPGGAVFVGRGIHHILDPAYTLRVQIAAPIEWRAARLVQAGEIPAARSLQAVRRVDRERHAYIRRHFGARTSDPICFDVVFDVSCLGRKTVEEIIVAALRAKLGVAPPP